MFQVIGLGDQVVDKYEHQHIMYPGGNALNFAVFAAKLGVRSAFLGAFGDDMEGRFVASVLRELGIDISRCRTFEGENGCARVELRDGDRVFLGSNRCGVLRTRGLPRCLLSITPFFPAATLRRTRRAVCFTMPVRQGAAWRLPPAGATAHIFMTDSGNTVRCRHLSMQRIPWPPETRF